MFYNILSLVAKTLLGWLVAGGLIGASNGQINASTKAGQLPVITTSNSEDYNWYYLFIPAIAVIILPIIIYFRTIPQNQKSLKNDWNQKQRQHIQDKTN